MHECVVSWHCPNAAIVLRVQEEKYIEKAVWQELLGLMEKKV